MLSTNNTGVPAAKIVGGKYDNRAISVEDKPTRKSDFKVLGIANDAKFQLDPLHHGPQKAAARAPLPESI